MGGRLNCLPLRNKNSSTTRFTCKSNAVEFPNTRHAFFHDYKLFWVLLKLLGLFPYRIKKNGQIEFKYISKEMVYSVFVYCAITTPVLLVLCLRFEQLYQVNGNFDQEVYLYVMSILLFPHLCIPLTHWYELRQFQFIFKRWWQFQTHYENTFNDRLTLKPNAKSKLLLFLLFVITSFVMVLNFEMFGFIYCWEVFAHFHILVLFSLHSLLLLGLCCRLRVIAHDVRLRLVQAVKTEDVSAVDQILSFWMTFSEITRLVGTLFYRMYLYLFVTIFAVSTVVLYSLLRAIAEHNVHLALLHNYCVLTSNSAWVFFACEFSERVAHDVGNRFILSLVKLRRTVKSSEMKYEIDSFVSIITSHPPYITFNEYITVNRKLFVSISGTMVTYLIVVLQFSQDYSDPKPFPPSNTTGLA